MRTLAHVDFGEVQPSSTKNMVLHITPSERAALQLLAIGSPANRVADELGVGERDVDEELAALFARMGVTDRRAALAVAMRRGLLTA